MGLRAMGRPTAYHMSGRADLHLTVLHPDPQQRLVVGRRPALDLAVHQAERAAVPRADDTGVTPLADHLAVAQRAGLVAAALDHRGDLVTQPVDEQRHVTGLTDHRLA